MRDSSGINLMVFIFLNWGSFFEGGKFWIKGMKKFGK